ncbi:MAG TPA: hypothetical protein VIG57_15645 [Candidatus Entotheonella sp.]|jgi:hypothetical protein
MADEILCDVRDHIATTPDVTLSRGRETGDPQTDSCLHTAIETSQVALCGRCPFNV